MMSVVPTFIDPLLEFWDMTLEGIIKEKRKIPLPTHKIVPRILVNEVRVVENKTINNNNNKKKDEGRRTTACLHMEERSPSHRL